MSKRPIGQGESERQFGVRSFPVEHACAKHADRRGLKRAEFGVRICHSRENGNPVPQHSGIRIPESALNHRARGFTLIELLIVISIIGILLTIAQPAYRNSVFRAKETVLKENLFAMRSAIDQYYADNGMYPSGLDILVSKGYLRSIPKDPITNSNTTWILVAPPAPEETGVYDVKSGSNAASISGTPHSEW